MIGENVVYITGRTNSQGGLYHMPKFIAGERCFATDCGLRLHNPTLIQRDWAEKTEGEPCSRCFPEEDPEVE